MAPEGDRGRPSFALDWLELVIFGQCANLRKGVTPAMDKKKIFLDLAWPSFLRYQWRGGSGLPALSGDPFTVSITRRQAVCVWPIPVFSSLIQPFWASCPIACKSPGSFRSA